MKGPFVSPVALCLGGARSELYVADSGASSIFTVAGGVVTLLAGSTTGDLHDGVAIQARFRNPQAVAAVPSGVVYVADTGNHAIRTIDLPDGRNVRHVSTLVANGVPEADGSPTLTAPGGLALDDRGNLLVADSGGNRIRLISLTTPATMTTLAGTTASGYANGPAAAARFFGPTGLLLSGALYVADTRNAALRVIYNSVSVTDCYPRRGPLAAGNTVRVFGNGFTAAAQVKFGQTDATSFTVVSDTELLVTAPGGVAGATDITVVTPAGQATLAGRYLYTAAPILTAVNPTKGPRSGGGTLTVLGANFLSGDTTIVLGGHQLSITSLSPTALTVVAPTGAGTVDVVVTTPGGTAMLPGAYRFLDVPAVTSFAPAAGRVGTSVTISGANFDTDAGGTQAAFGNTLAAILSVTATQLIVRVPDGAANGPISVSTLGGSAVSGAPFAVTTLMSINVTPANPSIAEGRSQPFAAVASYSDQSTQNVTASVIWSTSDAQLATITTNGVAAAHRWGSVTIRATSGSVVGTAQLTILPIVTSIAVTPPALSIAHHASGSLVATATYSDNTSQNVTATASWSSSANAIATVSAGSVAGASPGSATLTATLDGVSGSATVTVTKVVTSISVTPAALTIAHHASGSLAAMATYSDNTTQDVTATAAWSSSANAIATVSAGSVTAASPGSATVTATLDGVSGGATVTVTKVMTSIAVTPAALTIANHASGSLAATARYSDNSTQDATGTANWSSSADAVVTVAGGTVMGISPGSATITATLAGVSGNATVTIVEGPPAPQRLSVSPDSLQLVVARTAVLQAALLYDDGTSFDVTNTAVWSTSDENVAAADQGGLVTALGEGTAVITATYSSFSAAVNVTVTADGGSGVPVLTRVTVSPSSAILTPAASLHLVMMAFFSDQTGTEVTPQATWTTSADSVVTVDASGRVHAAGTGVASVTGSFNGSTAASTITVATESLSIGITSPANNALITTERIPVRGTASGFRDIGVAVNGMPARIDYTHAGTPEDPFPWSIEVATDDASVHLIAAVTSAATGAHVEAARDVRYAPEAQELTIDASCPSAIAPVNVGFQVSFARPENAVSYAFDYDGDGIDDAVYTELPESPAFIYNTPGMWNPRIRVTDNTGHVFTASTEVSVTQRVDVDSVLQQQWSRFVDALDAGNVSVALAQLASDSARDKYRDALTLIQQRLPQLAAGMRTILPVEIYSNTASYLLVRTENGLPAGYHIIFARGADGVWRVAQF